MDPPTHAEDAPWPEFSMVRLTVDLPESGLRRGDAGAIVMIHARPDLTYEVEFTDGAGRTRALLALRPEQLERVYKSHPEHER